MRHIYSAILVIAVLFLSGLTVSAQESELKVVDEVVAEVNDSVITLSTIKRIIRDEIDALVAQGKTREQATAEIESKRAEIIANVINEELILQRGKELGIESDVEAEVNQRFLQKMKEANIKTLDKLYEEMRKVNIDPDAIRVAWRRQITRDAVLQREVDSKVYWGFTAKEIKDYFEKNKAKFTKPETVTLTEMFLSFAGRDEAAVKEKAKQIVQQARAAGADFEKLVLENSERSDVQQNKGKVGTFTMEQLKAINEKLVAPIQATKAGAITDPIVLDEGVEILRVDQRQAASSESFFDETQVRTAMMYEILSEKRKEFLTKLKGDSYIKINETYRPLVGPLLFADDRKTEAKKTDEKKSNK